MAQAGTNEFRQGLKVEIDGEPFIMVSNEFVKPGKGQPFNRVKLKHLLTGRVVERTYKSGERVDLADVEETNLRLLYQESDGAVFMDDNTYDQATVPLTVIGDKQHWLKEEVLYTVVFYKGNPISIDPPTFMELKITETMPGHRGDTASGRVLKPATLETGAQVQVPIFIEEGEVVKIDTRDGSYVGRVS